MDMRVLAAVFLTLFAIAIGMSSGALDLQELRDVTEGFGTSGDLSLLLQRAGNASFNTSISGSITTPVETELRVRVPARLELEASPTTSLEVGDSTLRLSEDAVITVEGFKGTVHASQDNLTIQGTIRRISTPVLDFSYGAPRDFTAGLPRSMLVISRLDRQTFKFSNATGTVQAGGTTIEVSREKAWFNGFSGNLSVDTPRYGLEGTIRSAVLGDATVG